MILYNVDGWMHIKDNSYMFQELPSFANYLSDNKMFFTEENIVNILKNKLQNENLENSVFVDVGANVGTYTMQLAPMFHHSYSFEPGKNTYNILCGNIAINGLSDKTTLINTALDETEGEMIMHEYDILGSLTHISNSDTDFLNESMKTKGYNEYAKKIKVHTLDSYNIKNIKILKIDVEGNELKVLKGAVNTIKQSNYPIIVVESWEIDENDSEDLKNYKKTLRDELFSYLKDMNYNIESTDNPEVFICEYGTKETKPKVKTIFY